MFSKIFCFEVRETRDIMVKYVSLDEKKMTFYIDSILIDKIYNKYRKGKNIGGKYEMTFSTKSLVQ